ncbi:MAG: tRNA uracil 4-sulfurtransferase ThiI [Patescibacteria group bacterium]
MKPLIILHYGELILKGKNKKFFIKILIENIKNQLNRSEYIAILAKEGKVVVYFKNQTQAMELTERMSKIPGIANAALGFQCQRELTELKNCALQICRTNKVSTFKIQTSRSDKSFKLNSTEINRRVGGFIKDETKMGVNATKPELLIGIEISKDTAYVFGHKIQSPGGLPTGSSGKVICMMSGGIDSPVAAYMMMKRGAQVLLFHAQNKTIVSKQAQDKIEKLAAKLSEYQRPIKLYTVPFADIQKQIIANTESSYRMIVYRRFMHRLAEEIRKKEKAKALVTGDNLGQVASQTLENMILISQASDSLILRPIIGMNKQETVDLAEKIGTYEISILPYADCCSYLVAKHPQTRGKLENVEKFEKNMEIDTLVMDAIGKAEVKLFQ